MSAYIPVKCKSLKYVVFMLEIVQKYDVLRVVRDYPGQPQMGLTLRYMAAPFKMQILEIRFFSC